MTAPIHALAWLAWLAAIVAALTITRNPIYLALILVWIGGVDFALTATGARHESGVAAPMSPLRFGIFVVTFAALFNGLTVYYGDTVIGQIPDWIPILGGPITLEAIVYGALNGLALAGLFAAFQTAGRALGVQDVIRLIPRAFYPLAVTAAISVTFVPAMLRQFQQIREAQAVRGHRVRGLRDWMPLLMPLLIGALERALQLAEAMAARGFASSGGSPQPLWAPALLVAGLVAVAAGMLLRLMWGYRGVGLALIWLGVLAAGAVLRALGRRYPHTVYRPTPWRTSDWAVVGGALATAAAFVLEIPGVDRSSLFYYPYPSLTVPTFSAAIGMATGGLLAPAVVLASQRHKNERCDPV